MTRPTSQLVALCLLFSGVAGSARGQAEPPEARVLPATTQPAPFLVYAIPTRVVTLQAGMGVLVRLPEPAAMILSAEPAIARVQPASPTNLFVMGVGPGHTNVIATTEAGEPIGQFDIIVTPAAPSYPSSPGSVSRPAAPDAGRASEVRQAVRRPASGVRAAVAPAIADPAVAGPVIPAQARGRMSAPVVQPGDGPEAPQPSASRMRLANGLRPLPPDRQVASPAVSPSFSAGFILE